MGLVIRGAGPGALIEGKLRLMGNGELLVAGLRHERLRHEDPASFEACSLLALALFLLLLPPLLLL